MTIRRATAMLTLVAALCTPAAASADGDPASDVLLVQDAYFPYFPSPSKPAVQTLNRLLRELKAKGYPMKIAMILTVGDLGAYPELIDKPGPYAKLLESEIVFQIKKPHLLIVTQAGLAGRNLGPEADGILAEIDVDETAQSDGLVRAALEAAARIATANGHPTQVPEIEADKKPGGKTNVTLYVISGTIVLLGLLLIASSIRLRRMQQDGSSEDVDGADDDDGDRATPGNESNSSG